MMPADFDKPISPGLGGWGNPNPGWHRLACLFLGHAWGYRLERVARCWFINAYHCRRCPATEIGARFTSHAPNCVCPPERLRF